MPADKMFQPVLTGTTDKPGVLLSLLGPFLGTFKGWLARKVNTIALVCSAAATAWIGKEWIMLESLASRFGVDADGLAQLHANGVELQHVVTGLVSTVTFGIVEIILSRLSAKVAEKPPVALPV